MSSIPAAAWSAASSQVTRMHRAMLGLRASLEKMKAVDQAIPVVDEKELEKEYQALLADINR